MSTQSSVGSPHQDGSILRQGNEPVLVQILRENESVLRQVDEAVIAGLLERLRQAPHIFVAGKGRSGLIARCFAMRLMHLGLASYVVDETITPAICRNDLLIAYSASGETEEMCLAAEKGHKVGAQVIAITTSTSSRLAQRATLLVVLSVPHKRSLPPERNSIQYAGSLFEQSALLFCDAVILQAMQIWHASSAELAARHANLE